MPAAVVTILRGRWLAFWLGWITAGVLWFVGALLPEADASSQVRKRAALALGAMAAGFVALGLFGARPTAVLGMNGRALESSVGGIGLQPGGCSRGGEGWICARYTPEGSGATSYRVDVDGTGCWTASRIGSAVGGSPKELTGCASLINFVLD